MAVVAEVPRELFNATIGPAVRAVYGQKVGGGHVGTWEGAVCCRDAVNGLCIDSHVRR